MKTDYVIDNSMVGQTIGPKDGFLVSVTMTTAPKGYVVPDWNPGTRRWTSGYLQLRATGDSQNIYCANPHQWGYLSNFLVGNQSLGYDGDLRVVCCPKGAVFSLTLSDVPIDRTLPADTASIGASLLATIMREAAEREAAALKR